MQPQDDDIGQEHEPGELGEMPDQQSLNELFSATYEELRRLASLVSDGYPGSTLNPTALVNEAWLKLMNASHLKVKSELHFKRIAARAMRQVLVDTVRRRTTDKRGKDFILVSLDDPLEIPASSEGDLLKLDELLDELERYDPRQAALVEGRFFGGLNVFELADLLHVSRATVQREWRLAKAWLKYRLRKAEA